MARIPASRQPYTSVPTARGPGACVSGCRLLGRRNHGGATMHTPYTHTHMTPGLRRRPVVPGQPARSRPRPFTTSPSTGAPHQRACCLLPRLASRPLSAGRCAQTDERMLLGRGVAEAGPTTKRRQPAQLLCRRECAARSCRAARLPDRRAGQRAGGWRGGAAGCGYCLCVYDAGRGVVRDRGVRVRSWQVHSGSAPSPSCKCIRSTAVWAAYMWVCTCGCELHHRQRLRQTRASVSCLLLQSRPVPSDLFNQSSWHPPASTAATATATATVATAGRSRTGAAVAYPRQCSSSRARVCVYVREEARAVN